MKRRTEGKRFSRCEILTAETWGEVDNLFNERGRTNEDGTQSLGGVQQYVEEARGQAVAFLKARTLPYTPMVYWRTDSEGWTGEKPPRKFYAGSSGLPSYVRGLGHGGDSLEELAARIIWSASELERGIEEEKAPIRAAIELSEARILARVYGMDSRDHSWRGQKGARARWGGESRDILAGIVERLASRKDTLGEELDPSELWGELYGQMDALGLNPDDSEEDQYSYEGDGGQPLTYVAFRKRLRRKRES